MFGKIGTTILTKTVMEFFKKTWECFKNRQQALKNASHDYSRSYKKRHGQINVSCVGMREPLSLDDVYVAVQFLNQHTEFQYSSAEDVEQAFRERDRQLFDSTSDERQDGTQVANSKQYLMVLGGPGVGKSTFLRKIGLEALKEKDGNFEHECIPVFLELKRFAEDQINVESWITAEFKVCGYPYPEQITKSKLESR